MKVAIFSPYATVVPHFETDLDIAQQHLDAGDSVEFINCMGELENCDFNIDRDPERCRICIGRRQMGMEMLTPSVHVEDFSTPPILLQLSGRQRSNLNYVSIDQDGNCDDPFDETIVEPKTEFESVAELIDYRLENFDLGYAALSSLVSICRDPEPDVIANRELLARFIRSAWQAFKKAKRYIDIHEPDRVYVFNGRFASMRAILRACQAASVDCYMHERGCDSQHYELAKNHMLHEISYVESVIQEKWDAANTNPQRKRIASQWFIDRVKRVESNWHSFVKDQQVGRLPADWDESQKNVAIFTTSPDEFVAIGDCWKNPIYENQVDAITRIAKSLIETNSNIHLTVRVHPNLKDIDNEAKRQMLAIDFPNVTMVAPDAPIDTYELMRKCDIVAAFGSTVGIEAVYWDKPSVLLGPSFYRNLGGVYCPETHEEAIGFFQQTLDTQTKEGALKYGFWLQTRGHRHQYFTASDLFEGQFKNQTLYARPEPKKSIARTIKKKAREMLQAWAG